MKYITVTLLVFFISSCIFVPVTSEKQKYYSQCDMATKKLTLSLRVKQEYEFCSGNSTVEDAAACLALVGIVASATAVISGSIVIAGNVIHWAEYKSQC